MGDPKNLSLQAGYLVCANNLRREAKLCDIILYVQGRMGAMVGYPAHKLLLISASKYFKLLFEREDLRNYCHFPHLSEEGVFAVLDIIYGREIREETNLDDALMAARFLQVDCAVDTLELKKEEAAQAAARASPEPKRSSSVSSDQIVKKRKTQDNTYKTHNLPPTQSPSHAPADVKLFRNSSLKSPESSGMSRTQEMSESQDSPFSQTEHSAGGYQDSSSLDHDPSTPQDDDNNMTAIVKMEPDVDLTADDSEHGLLSQGYGQQQDHDNLTFSGHSFGAMNTDNSQQDGTSNMYGMSDYGGQGSYQGGQGGNASGCKPRISSSGVHMRTYTQTETELYCKYCGKKFEHISMLNRHMRVHQNTGGLFECGICTKMFSCLGNLSKHEAVHTGERRYWCDICGQRFAFISNMKRHRRCKHADVHKIDEPIAAEVLDNLNN